MDDPVQNLIKERQRLQAERERLEALAGDDKIASLRKLEAKLITAKQDLKTEKELRQHAESDLAAAEKQIELLEFVEGRVKPKAAKRGSKGRGGSATALICWNDWHAEANIDREAMDGKNEFNPSVFKDRWERIQQKSVRCVEAMRALSNIEEIVVWLGGDMINGVIHDELKETNFLGQTEAVLFIQDQIAGGLEHLKKNIKADRWAVVANYGNHGRDGKQKYIKAAWRHSWEYAAYHTLAKYFAKDWTWLISKGHMRHVDIQGQVVRFTHGDQVKYAGGVRGVHEPLHKKIHRWDRAKPADQTILGHFHQFITAWNYVVCGALVGYDDFADFIGADFQPPTQTFIVLDKDRGRVAALPMFAEAGS